MKIGFLLVILLVSLIGCNQKHGKNAFRLQENALSFRTSFPAYNLNYFTDSQQREFVSFADFVTYKKMSFHALNSDETWSISLDSLMNAEKVKFVHYHIISPDSILLLTKYTNQFYLINRKAEVMKKINLSGLLIRGIEFVPPVYFGHNTISFAVNHYPTGKLSTQTEIDDWNARSMKMEQIGKLEIGTESGHPTYSGKNLISRFLHPNDLDAQGTYYIVNKQQVYYFSPYSDTIYLIHENRIEPLVKITSRIGKIHITPSSRKQYNENSNCVNEAYIRQSFICEVLFDDKRNLVYVFVRKPKDGKHFSFNILVYDRKFRKLNEVEFDGKNYYTSGFVGEKGLYLLRNYTKHPNQKIFDLLNYEK